MSPDQNGHTPQMLHQVPDSFQIQYGMSHMKTHLQCNNFRHILQTNSVQYQILPLHTSDRHQNFRYMFLIVFRPHSLLYRRSFHSEIQCGPVLLPPLYSQENHPDRVPHLSDPPRLVHKVQCWQKKIHFHPGYLH